MIGDTGVVVEATGLGLYLGMNSHPPDKPAGWRGLYVYRGALYLPGELAETLGKIEVTKLYIGNGGFSGDINEPSTLTLLFGVCNLL